MDSHTKLTVVQRCPISPPSLSVPPTSLSLTFLDIPWLLFSPTQPLFFYEFPTTTHHFTHTVLSDLKRTLSLTLEHFFPFAGKLACPSPPAEPSLEYSDGDSVLLTVTEAVGCFKHLCGNHPKVARDFHSLVPTLSGGAGQKLPLLAIQITVFPDSGVCIGFTLRHVAADWRTFDNFLRRWASLTRSGEALEIEPTVTVHDRSVIRDPIGLRASFLKEWWDISSGEFEGCCSETNNGDRILTRATFLMGPKDMERIKKWILDRSESLFGSTRLLLSPYVLTCAFVWVCWMKAQGWSSPSAVDGEEDDDGGVHYLGFIAGGINRVGYTVPSSYVGNCVGFGRCSASRNDLLGEEGVGHAAKALGDTIEKLNRDVLGGATNWISEWEALRGSPERHLMMTGSPKLHLYGLDFGWGRPMKIEDVSIDRTGAISLCQGRKVAGSIEIGLALPNFKMDAFTNLFRNGLLT